MFVLVSLVFKKIFKYLEGKNLDRGGYKKQEGI